MCCSLPCLSFSLAPPPPTPTLFPYTTLFRSTRWSPASRDGRSPAGRERDRAEQASGHLSGSDQRRRCRVGPDIQGPQAGDRKSTRLNSSHVATSYAVFCLKKKNTNSSATTTRYSHQT